MTTTMKLQTGSEYSGFVYEKQIDVPEEESVFHLFRHKKTDMQLVWLENDDDNKTFCIGFRTLPSDNTGVFHILEHSVLMGSRHYPLRSSFDLLGKSALSSFRNAMTLPLATVFPVSSPSAEELLQLTRFYLDAVFFPNALSDPSILRQEGWRYEFEEDGSLKGVNGVVFNEMQKYSSNYDAELSPRMKAALFPDSLFAFSSGGIPEEMINLSFEQFVDTYRKFYYPGNALAFLAGAFDILPFLSLIDSEFLSSFDEREAVALPPLQQPVSVPLETVSYIAENEESPLVYSMGFGVSKSEDEETPVFTAIDLLLSLLKQQDQPLYRALVSSGLVKSFSFCFHNLGCKQGWIELSIRGVAEEKIPEVRAAVDTALEAQLLSGLDKDYLAALLDSEELRDKEWSSSRDPHGIEQAMSIMNNWASGNSPEKTFEKDDCYSQLREKQDSGYFEELCRKALLENHHKASFFLCPSQTLAEEKKQAFDKLVQSRFSALTKEEQNRLREEYKADLLKKDVDESSEWPKYYKRPSLSGLERLPRKWMLEESSLSGIRSLTHQEDTDGVLYISLEFDISDLTPQELLLVSSFLELSGRVKTAATPVSVLKARISRYLSHFSALAFTHHAQFRKSKQDTRVLEIRFSTLGRNLLSALEVITEVLTGSRFSDTAYMKGYFADEVHIFQMAFRYWPDLLAEVLLRSRFSLKATADPYMHGLESYFFYKQLSSLDDFTVFAEQAYALQKRIFTASRLTFSVVGDAEKYAPVIASHFASVLPAGEPVIFSVFPLQSRRNEAILSSGANSSAVMLLPLNDYDAESGLCAVAAGIIRTEYLWNEIRTKGGAYGGGARFGDGAAALFSNSDPSCSVSLSLFRTVPSWLRSYCASDPDISGHILSSSVEKPVYGRHRINQAISWAMAGVTYEDLCRCREELLSATPAKLADLADRMEAALEDATFCVVADKAQVDACHPDNIITL